MRALVVFVWTACILGGVASAQVPQGLTAVRGIKVGPQAVSKDSSVGADTSAIGALAADMVSEAIVRGVKSALAFPAIRQRAT